MNNREEIKSWSDLWLRITPRILFVAYSDADQSGADTIDTLVEWHESVGGIDRASPEDDEDHDIDDPYQVEVDENV